MAGVVTLQMLNGQAAQLPVVRRDLGESAYDAVHGGTKGSYLTPWRKEMLPPDDPDAFGTQRQIPSDGEIHVAQDASGYRMYPKEITPDHDGRQLPYEGDVPFNAMRLPVESYKTRAEAFKFVPYWSVKPYMGPDDWPSRKLFPAEPDLNKIESIEQDILPLPFTQDNHRGYSVKDIPMDFNPDLDLPLGVSGMGGLGQVAAGATSAAAGIAAQAVADTAAANPVAASQPGVMESLIGAATQLALASIQGKTQEELAKIKAETGVPSTTPTTTMTLPTYRPPVEEPIYTKPWFLALAALGLVGGGYLLLKK